MSLANGIHFDVPWEAYAASPRLNFSLLKEMARSPAHFHHRLTAPKEDTEAMKFGRAVHLAVLEPDKFRKRVVRWDGGRRAGKEWEAFKALSAGLEILTAEEWDEVHELAAAVHADPDAGQVVRGAQTEVAVCWTHAVAAAGAVPGYSFQLKGRLDMVRGSGLALADLKTTRDGHPEKFPRQAYELHMHVQAALYSDGYRAATGREAPPYLLVVVEKAAPYVVQVREVGPIELELGRVTYRAWLDRLALCKREGRWPGYVEGIQRLELPRWAYPKDDDIADLGLVIGEEQAE